MTLVSRAEARLTDSPRKIFPVVRPAQILGEVNISLLYGLDGSTTIQKAFTCYWFQLDIKDVKGNVWGVTQ